MTPIELSVLIVDDMPKNVQLLGSILKNEPIEIEFATSGKEALEWLHSKAFDLVLLDIMMPEMDGFEVCQQIKLNPETSDIAVIFITAKTDIQNIVRGFELGAVDYVTKPFNKSELLVRVRTHLTLQHQKRMLEDNNALKDKLISIIGHDLRNPVGNIKAYIDAFLSTKTHPVSAEVKILLRDLSMLSEQAFALLENLLFWAKNQSGRLIANPVKANLAEIVNNALLFIHQQAENKDLVVNNLLTDTVEAFFDPEQISVVIRNLLWNAVKYTPNGGEITVGLRSINESGKSWVKIEISDNGIGIPLEHQKKIFDSSYHFTTYGTNNEKGSGLGLHLCREFVEMNGGTIGLSSQPENGSLFYFTLPKY